MSVIPQEQPVVGQDPQVPAVALAAPAAPAGPGPWDADLVLAFDDPGVRSRVDAFLRTKTQPRITQLEQQLAASRDAVALYNDLRERTDDTFVAIASEIYGDKAGESVLKALQDGINAGDTAEQVIEAATAAAGDQPLDPRIQALIDAHEQQQAATQYDTMMAQTIAANPDLTPEMLHPFVSVAGNFDGAVAAYRQYEANFMAAHGITPQQAAGSIPPPVMGSDTGGVPSTTPVEPRKQTLNEAIDDVFRNQASPPPPVMG